MKAHNILKFLLQFIRDKPDAFLGCIRAHRPGKFRSERHQNIHAVLGHAHVRNIFRHQYRSASQSTHRHDEPLLPTHISK